VEWKKEAHGNGNKIIIIENDSLVEKKTWVGIQLMEKRVLVELLAALTIPRSSSNMKGKEKKSCWIRWKLVTCEL
jgi:hypothetical protein